MKLNDLVKEEKETLEEYLARTYCCPSNWPDEDEVLVWPTKEMKGDPKKIKMRKHRRYCKTLKAEKPMPQIHREETIFQKKKCDHDYEHITVKEEKINGEVENIKVICTCGEMIQCLKIK